jgi:hypothetical protein
MKGASLIAISEPKKSLDFHGFGQNTYGTGVKKSCTLVDSGLTALSI